MDAAIQRIFESGVVNGRSGRQYKLDYSVDLEESGFMDRIIRHDPSVVKTLEVGCADVTGPTQVLGESTLGELQLSLPGRRPACCTRACGGTPACRTAPTGIEPGFNPFAPEKV
jgi:hypothetical protein